MIKEFDYWIYSYIMAIILFSVYYIHEKRFELIRDGFLPLFDKIKYSRMDYFLSTYKGENITMMLDVSDREIETTIKTHFQEFFAKYSIEVAEKRLPTYQLFLEFKPNTLHLWEFNPFRNKQRDLHKLNILKSENELSDKCLSVLSVNRSWGQGESVQFWLNIVIIISYLLQLELVSSSRFVNALQLSLKSKFKSKVNLFQEYLKNGKRIFLCNRDSVIQHYEYLIKTAESPGVQNNDLSEWINLVKNWMMSPDNSIHISSIDRSISLIFGIKQRIDLNPKGLVIALGIFQMLKDERLL